RSPRPAEPPGSARRTRWPSWSGCSWSRSRRRGPADWTRTARATWPARSSSVLRDHRRLPQPGAGRHPPPRRGGLGGVNRPRAVRARPGGKGLNVARTLHALGVDVLVLGLAGGITGAGVETALRERCVPAAFTPVGGETRRTF